MTEWNAETAEWYAANYGEFPTNRLAVDELNLPAKAAVLDIGCGTGAALRHAAATVTEGGLIGVDPVPRMIEIAKQRTVGHPASARIEFRLGSAEKIPLGDASSDFVFAFDSIDHWRDIRQGLREIQRVLAPGGTLAVAKDRGVPGAASARRKLVATVETAGFAVAQQRDLDVKGVRFTLWTFVRSQR